MNRQARTIALLVALLFALVHLAPVEAQAPVTLLPLTSEGYGIESVSPEGWGDLGQGIVARQESPSDIALLAQQSAPVGRDVVMASLLPQFGLTEEPESTGAYQGPALDWTLYEFEFAQGTKQATADLALAEHQGTSYIVLLLSSPDEHDMLHEQVFEPVLAAFAPFVEPPLDVPYHIEEVTFPNGDITLAGALTLPDATGPHPVVVLVSGSGPQDRDETLGGGIAIKPFRLLADALTRDGVAVLRYDDRGVGQSSGVFSEATVAEFATDAEAAIAYLLTRPEIDPNQIGLLGHSEGGQVAAMLGARNDDLDFIISLAGPGVVGRDIYRLQSELIPRAEGANDELIASQKRLAEGVMERLDDPQALEEFVYQETMVQLLTLPKEQRDQIGDLETYARMATDQAVSQYGAASFATFLAYDPAPDWEQTTIPVLAIFGGKDVQVDAGQNAAPVAAALTKAGNRDFAVVVLPDANHLFQAAESGAFSEYGTLPAEFTPDLLPTILNWVDLHVVKAGEAVATPVAPAGATPIAVGAATPVAAS